MVSDLKNVAYKGCTIAAQKKISFFRRILPYYQDFFGIGATIRIGHASGVPCHVSHVRCHISDVTRHVSPVANAIVICWQAGNFFVPVNNSVINV